MHILISSVTTLLLNTKVKPALQNPSNFPLIIDIYTKNLLRVWCKTVICQIFAILRYYYFSYLYKVIYILYNFDKFI